MKIYRAVVVCIFCTLGFFVHATPQGRMEYANIASKNGKPAICLPDNAKAPFPVGWVMLSESHAQDAGMWGLKLKHGATPLALKSGECFAYGAVPEAYELMRFGTRESKLLLEVNKTYVFRVNNAYRSTDTYVVVFCVGGSPDGGFKFFEYTPLADGGRVVPSCDARKNSNVSSSRWCCVL